jgi:hypothetical protein
VENLDYDSDRASSTGPDAAPAVTTADYVTSVDAVTAADTVTRRDSHDSPRMHPIP